MVYLQNLLLHCKMIILVKYLKVLSVFLIIFVVAFTWISHQLVFDQTFYKPVQSVLSKMNIVEDEFYWDNETWLQEKLKLALQDAKYKNYIILVWEPQFDDEDPFPIDSSKCGSCQLSFDKNKINETETKAVVFHFTLDYHKMPVQRRKDQFYVWWTWESSVTLRRLHAKKLKEYDHVFNLTMSYRRDSDIYFPVNTAAEVFRYSANTRQDIDRLWTSKTHFALWIVSNCGSTIGAVKRMNFVKQLINSGLVVDQKGHCISNGSHFNESVHEMTNYKFYLAFENSYHCKDYITEKVFRNALDIGIIPVVWGAKKADYEALLPPGSYVFAEDFKNTTLLINYLKFVGANEKAYKEYFGWRLLEINDMPLSNRATGWCQLCRVLHGINVDDKYGINHNRLNYSVPPFGHAKNRIVPSLRKYFYGTERRSCLYSF